MADNPIVNTWFGTIVNVGWGATLDLVEVFFAISPNDNNFTSSSGVIKLNGHTIVEADDETGTSNAISADFLDFITVWYDVAGIDPPDPTDILTFQIDASWSLLDEFPNMSITMEFFWSRSTDGGFTYTELAHRILEYGGSDEFPEPGKDPFTGTSLNKIITVTTGNPAGASEWA